MNYLLTEDQMSIRELVKDFAETKVKPFNAEWDRNGIIPVDTYKEAMDLGLHCTMIAEEYGGMGLPHFDDTVVKEELAKVDAGFAVGCSANGLASEPVMIGGTEEQKHFFMSYLNAKKFAGFCLTEPDAGSDAGAVKTTAKFDAETNEYVINGQKCFITNGPLASVYTVIASTDRSKGLKGLSAFIVPRELSDGTPVKGVSVGKEEDKFGIRLSATSEVIFEDVRIPKDYLIGEEGKGFGLTMKCLDASRPSVGTMACGIAQRALEEAVEYAHTRHTFGKPIAKLQAIQFKLADMEMGTAVARQYCRYVAAVQDKGGIRHSRQSSIAKCFAGDNAVKVTLEALQIFSGYGYSREYPLEKLVRDAKIYQIFEGTNEIQRVVIAGHLLAGM